jgi:predicted negative regulator of RcsB-dependent stress response
MNKIRLRSEPLAAAEAVDLIQQNLEARCRRNENAADLFARLVQQRDLAAYRAVSTIQVVLDFFEAQDFESAQRALRNSLAEFRQADERITAFRTTHKKENQSECPPMVSTSQSRSTRRR